jgi:hypothetical protein
MSTPTRRQFLTTLGTAAVAVPLAAALSKKVVPKATNADISFTTKEEWVVPAKAIDWHVRYAQFAMGPGSKLMIESRFGTDPVRRDYFSAERVVLDPEKNMTRYLGAVWDATETIYPKGDRPWDGERVWARRDIKVKGELRVQYVTWKEAPGEWMSTVRYVVDWQTPAQGIPNWNQASSMTAHDHLPITS